MTQEKKDISYYDVRKERQLLLFPKKKRDSSYYDTRETAPIITQEKRDSSYYYARKERQLLLLHKKRETALIITPEDKGHHLASDSQENPNSLPRCLIHGISFSSHISSIYTKFSFSLLFPCLLCMNQFFHYTINQKS